MSTFKSLPNLQQKANGPISVFAKLVVGARRWNVRGRAESSVTKEGNSLSIKRKAAVAAAAALAFTAVSCTDQGSGTEAESSTFASGTSATGPAATAGVMAHNDVDIRFAQGMIPHHAQAIEMSDMLLAKEGIDPSVVRLAEQIKAAQSPEIDQMNGWLSEWGVDTSATPPSSGSMPDHDMSAGGMPGMSGDGMMSDDDMAALQNAQGAEAARLFLTQMIEHHNGAIMMAQQEIDAGKFPATVDLARSIVSAQQQEIVTMEQILESF